MPCPLMGLPLLPLQAWKTPTHASQIKHHGDVALLHWGCGGTSPSFYSCTITRYGAASSTRVFPLPDLSLRKLLEREVPTCSVAGLVAEVQL